MKHQTAFDNLANAEAVAQTKTNTIKNLFVAMGLGIAIVIILVLLYKGFWYAIGPSDELLTYNKLHSECMKQYPHISKDVTVNMAMSNICDQEVKAKMK